MTADTGGMQGARPDGFHMNEGKEGAMKWRIYYNTCFYSDVVADSEDAAVEEIERALDLEDLFQVNQVEPIEEGAHA